MHVGSFGVRRQAQTSGDRNGHCRRLCLKSLDVRRERTFDPADQAFARGEVAPVRRHTNDLLCSLFYLSVNIFTAQSLIKRAYALPLRRSSRDKLMQQMSRWLDESRP